MAPVGPSCAVASGSGALDALESMARQHCHTGKVDRDYNGQVAGTHVTDSGGISANAEALEILWASNPSRFRIVAAMGRMVVGYWPENDPNVTDQPRGNPAPQAEVTPARVGL